MRRRAAAAVVLACTLTACTQTQPGSEDAVERPSPSSSASSPATSETQPSPTASKRPTPTPSPAPTLASAAPGLARQLRDAWATLRDRSSSPDDVRRAGETQQLAVRAVSMRGDPFVRRVTALLPPPTARAVLSDVRAAQVLRGLTDPQPRLPRWRIVQPPPPARLLAHYRSAQRRVGVHWSYLAAIHLVETRMGRIRGTSTAGARGPMQFLPSTWEIYGEGGDIESPRDAIHAAARLLRANGAPVDMAGALFRYNPSDSYVEAVMAYARTMRRWPSAYRGYWHWRVFYRHTGGTFVLPEGYPRMLPYRVASP